MTATTGDRYTRTAIVFHWSMAALIVVGFTMGWSMSDMPLSPTRIRLFSYHKWIGITILGLAAARLAWRATHRPPALPDSLPRWRHGAAHAGHALLYGLFFAVPLAGWAYSSAAGFPVVYLGFVPLPDWVSPDKALAKQLVTVHATLAFGLAIVVLGHIAAALSHGFAEPLGYLRRMTSSR